MIPECAHSEDMRWLSLQFGKLPARFRAPMAARYSRAYRSDGRVSANLGLLRLVESLPAHCVALSAGDGELVKFAERRARWAARVGRGLSARECYRVLSDGVRKFGIDPPEVDDDAIGCGVTYEGAVERMKCPIWWRRRLRRLHDRTIEAAARVLGLVNKRDGIYSSDEIVHRRGQQRRRNYRMLRELQAVNELGERFTLEELAALSVSNPEIRRGELMMRIAGFEAVADERGDVGEFITLTCPSRMHAARTRGGVVERNPKFDGTTPREAQAYLGRVWARVRAALARHGIRLYGFRVAEPNHDGCPHWHFLVFLPAWARRRVRFEFMRYGLQADGDESGARLHRVTFKSIDRAKGTAAGYIAKYIAKNIDGHGLDADWYGGDPGEAAARVDAWAACWGIRQFQQVGGPPVTVWRELRRMDWEDSGVLERARVCADAGDWRGFVEAMGGPVVPRRELPIRPAYWQEIDQETGELPVNRYGEIPSGQLFGLCVGGVYHLTRWHRWAIGREAPEPLPAGVPMHEREPERWGEIKDIVRWGPPGRSESEPSAELLERARNAIGFRSVEVPSGVAYSWEALRAGEAGAPWSSVNNCTRPSGAGGSSVGGDGPPGGKSWRKRE